jgi:hypothetical protein
MKTPCRTGPLPLPKVAPPRNAGPFPLPIAPPAPNARAEPFPLPCITPLRNAGLCPLPTKPLFMAAPFRRWLVSGTKEPTAKCCAVPATESLSAHFYAFQC